MFNLGDLATHMTNKMPPKCPENLYRKQYGTLKQCIAAGKGICAIFYLDNTVMKFHKHDKVMANQHLFAPEALDRYLQGRQSYLQKHLTLAKNNNMNICARCETKFYTNGNPADACMGDRRHEAAYDWSLSENVIECKIKK